MKLTCEVNISVRPGKTAPPRSLGKATRATISVGRKSGRNEEKGTVFLLVCTAKEKTGTKYKVHGNILQVFNKFVQEGKATIRMNEPPHDLFISKADPSSLKSLLSLLKLSARDIDQSALTTLAPAKLVELEKPKKELIVNKRTDYPLVKPFPDKLQRLTISNCSMRRFDRRITRMSELTYLSLSDNLFPEIPLGLTNMIKLTELCLVNNQIRDLDWRLFCGNFSTSLKVLDLRNNKLVYLPSTFCKLENLVNLKLDNNELYLLPRGMGNFTKLRFLSASCNKLKVLPCSIKNLRLESLDLSHNPFLSFEQQVVMNCLDVPSLVDLAGQTVKTSKYHYDSSILPSHLCNYLDSAKQCGYCRKYCFTSCIHFINQVNIHHISQTVISAGPTQSILPAESFLCSQKCLSALQKSSFRHLY